MLGALLLAPAVAAHDADVAFLAVTVLLVDTVWWTTLAVVALIKSRTAPSAGP